jgi:hypothetical protein
MMRTEAWRSLDCVARCAYLELAMRYAGPGSNNGRTDRGFVMVRTRVLSPERPVLLHEMLHAYHAQILKEEPKNRSILFYYKEAKSKKLYPADAYLMTNEKEFFAVTASVFLSGKADGGVTQSDIKQNQPDYFKYLGWLFETERAPSATPVASAD